MHGVKRTTATPDVLEAERRRRETLDRISHLRQLEAEFGSVRNGTTEQVMLITGNLLMVNPEHYTAWNARKRAIQSTLAQISPHDLPKLKELMKEELEFSMHTIQAAPKSYAAWYHRRWLFSTLPLQPSEQLDFCLRELRLCAKLLDLDCRNFHCWNYRAFLVACHPLVGAADGLDFTLQKIYQNFSNHSAWHRRAVVLEKSLQSRHDCDLARTQLARDAELVKAALFTEPADQSAWQYHEWLVALGLSQDIDPRISAVYVLPSELAIVSRCFGPSDIQTIAAGDADLPPIREHVHGRYLTRFYRKTGDCSVVTIRFTDGTEETISEAAEETRARNTRALLEVELANIRELLDLEPNAPLALHSCFHLSYLLGRPAEQLAEMLSHLSACDPLRHQCYTDTQARVSTEHSFASFYEPLRRFYRIEASPKIPGLEHRPMPCHAIVSAFDQE